MRYAAAVRPGEFVLQNRISSKKFRRQTVDLIGFGAGFLLPFLPKGRLFPPGGPGSLCNFSQIPFIADGKMHGRLHFICRKRRGFYQVFPIIIEKGTNCLWLKTISHTKGFDGAIQVS